MAGLSESECHARTGAWRANATIWPCREKKELCLHDSDGVVVKYCGNVFGGELVGSVTDEQTCLAHSTVTDDNASVEVESISNCQAKSCS